MVLRCLSVPDEKIDLCFYPCGSGIGPGDRDTYCQEPLRIYKTDYIMLLLPYLESKFPESDVCRGRDNRTPAGTWNVIIQKIEADMSHIHFDDTVFDSYSRPTGWVVDALDQEDTITAEGNQQPDRTEIILFLLTFLKYLHVPDNSHSPLLPARISIATPPISRTAPPLITCFTPSWALQLPIKAAAVERDAQHPAHGFYTFRQIIGNCQK